MDRLTITRPQVAQLIGCSRKQTYILEAVDPDFPKPGIYGKQLRWLVEDVRAYVRDKHKGAQLCVKVDKRQPQTC